MQDRDAPIAEAPYILATILLALGLQAVILRMRNSPPVARHVTIGSLAVAAALLSGRGSLE